MPTPPASPSPSNRLQTVFPSPAEYANRQNRFTGQPTNHNVRNRFTDQQTHHNVQNRQNRFDPRVNRNLWVPAAPRPGQSDGWPLLNDFRGRPTSPQGRAWASRAGSVASCEDGLSPETLKDMRQQGKLEADRARIKEASENIADYRKPFNFMGRIVGLFSGFTGVGIAIISTVAALVPHVAGIALFAAPQFAIPMAVGLTLVGLLAAWGIRSMGRAYARGKESVQTDGGIVEELKAKVLSMSPRTGPQQRVLRAADRYEASVESAGRDARKALRDGLMGLLWPASMLTGLLLALRPKPRR